MGNYNQLWNKHKVKVPFYLRSGDLRELQLTKSEKRNF